MIQSIACTCSMYMYIHCTCTLILLSFNTSVMSCTSTVHNTKSHMTMWSTCTLYMYVYLVSDGILGLIYQIAGNVSGELKLKVSSGNIAWHCFATWRESPHCMPAHSRSLCHQKMKHQTAKTKFTNFNLGNACSSTVHVVHRFYSFSQYFQLCVHVYHNSFAVLVAYGSTQQWHTLKWDVKMIVISLIGHTRGGGGVWRRTRPLVRVDSQAQFHWTPFLECQPSLIYSMRP